MRGTWPAAARRLKIAVAAAALLALAGCGGDGAPMPTVARVDLQRFMGEWYVIASIPTFIETGAHNAVESYRLEGDRIETTFRFRDGGFDGELRTYRPTAFVRDPGTNAVWGMQFIWPFEAEYRIVYLDAAYSRAVIARSARDYAWIMAREPVLGEDEYRALAAVLDGLGYDANRIRRVPQRWD